MTLLTLIILVLYARLYMLERMQKQSIKSMNLLSDYLSNHLFKRIVDYVGYSVGNHEGTMKGTMKAVQ